MLRLRVKERLERKCRVQVGPPDSGEKPSITKELNCKRGGEMHLFHFILREAQPVLHWPELQQVLLYRQEAAADLGLYPGQRGGAGMAAKVLKSHSRDRLGSACSQPSPANSC